MPAIIAAIAEIQGAFPDATGNDQEKSPGKVPRGIDLIRMTRFLSTQHTTRGHPLPIREGETRSKPCQAWNASLIHSNPPDFGKDQEKKI